MGRPEPSVLFAQTFAHAHLDEYVDEVIFSEPVVVTACEFLDQSSSSSSPAVTLLGATSPPSFALEVFVHCEGETRFRRLCQPFLYSPSSSNVLEVEAIVTSHLAVRGSYRSLSLVIYGNTGEDLGQFTLEVDLDSSFTNTVSIVEGNLEDLPPALNPVKATIEEPISPLKSLTLRPYTSDISAEMKQFLQLSFKILEMPNAGDALNAVVNSLVSTAATLSTQSLQLASRRNEVVDHDESYYDASQARKELLDIFNNLLTTSGNSENLSENISLESEGGLLSSKELVNTLAQHYHIIGNCESVLGAQLPQSKLVMAWLSAALILCSCKESCFNFVNGGGMKQLSDIFCTKVHSSAATLMLLGVIEQASRHSIGCEGFLNWWPREDDKIPSGTSEGYNQLLKLLMQKPRHDVASLATYILHRTRVYEVASRYEFAVLHVLGGVSSIGNVMPITVDMLASAKLQLKKLLKLINSSALVEDPSQVASTGRSLILGEMDGLLSYKATSRLVTLSNCRFSSCDIDAHVLFLLKERGFLPLSAALLSSSTLLSETGHARELLMDITSDIASIILSLVFCRSGLMFLLLDPEISTTVILALKGSDLGMQESIPLRYASVLISKGFFCRPREIGIIMKTHLRVMNVIDRLITSQLHSEELLWGLWELCCISRSDCGRQALLAITHFPEAVSVLIAALHSVKELEPVSVNNGTSALNLAIFHSAVEIFEVIVLDSTSSSMSSWIGHAKELHKALHSSSPGSNRKDAPTRLLELIDGGVVYHKNGAIGLLRYAAVLASGGDALMASTNILACDEMDVDNVVNDGSGSSEGNIIDNLLGKPITESRFLGFSLRDSSVAQLTTTFRILAFISENSAVAGALYDEGAVMVVHAVLLDCKLMLEKSSNNYDYLVDEGTECNTASDILLERNREQSVVDLLVPCLSLLINLLHKLKDTKEQHRNKKLIKALLHLHRELSPKLASCAVDLSYPHPDLVLRYEAVCHLIVSALACWPAYGWTPTLFHFLLDSLHATSLLAMGPKETCSLLFLFNDILPDEGVSLWKNGMPILSAYRQLAVGTLLGPKKEREINWYLMAGHKEKLIGQLTPMLHKIAEIVLHCAISALVVLQDLLRIFIIRMVCLHADSAAILLRPMILWVDEWLSESSTITDTDAYKVCRLLDFLASLLEHPRAKPILLREGVVLMLSKVLKSSTTLPQHSWCIPACRSISLISDTNHDRDTANVLTAEDCSLLLFQLFRLVKFLPVGKELFACLSALKSLGSLSEGRSGLQSIYTHAQSSYHEDSEPDNRRLFDASSDHDELKKSPPLLFCLITLLNSIEMDDVPSASTIEAVEALTSGALTFCMDKRRLKSQWDFVLEEMSWLANNFAQERLWKVTAAAQISQRVAYASRVRFQQQSFLQKHKEVSHTLAEAVLQFWHMIQAECKGSESECFKKDIAVGVKGYAVRFLEYNSSQAQWQTNQAPAPPDSISDLGIIDCSWEDNLTEENLFYTVPPGAIEAYRKAIDSHLQQFERIGSSMQEEVDTSGYDAVADNAFEEDEGETSTYYLPGGFEGIKSTKATQKRRKNFTVYGPRSYEMGGDMPYMPSVERTAVIQPSVSSGKRYGSNLNVAIPTKRVRTASRQRIISPFNAGTSGHIQVPNRTDASSGDNNSFQDEQSILHGGSQMPNNMEVESVGEYEKQLHFDSMEVSNRPKKKKKAKHLGSTFEHRWQLDSNFQNDQKDHSRRLDTHQFDSNGSSVASQMSNMSNPNKFMKLLVRDRGRKVKAPKTPVGQPGSGSPWSLFEDQALVVLVHDMGPNWELISDAINSTLQFKCIFRKSKECKERHKILMDRNSGDGADSAEDSGSSQPYPSTLPGIPEGSARQLFQRLQGPMEEDTLKSHFEKIIMIGQKQHYRTQNDNQDPKQLQQPHSSHAFALSQVCPNNLNGGHVLTPLELEAISSSPDGLPVGYQGPHSGGLPAVNQGAVPTMLPGSGSTSSAPGSSHSVHGNNLPSASAPHNPSVRDGRYGVPRTGSLSVDDQQRLQQYNQMLNARNAQQSSLPPGSHSVNDRGVRILPAGNGTGVMSGVNRNIKMARPGYQGTASTSMLNSGMATSSPASMHSGPGPGQGNSMLRPRDPMHMVRPNQNTDQQVSQSGATQAVPPFSSGTSSSFPNQISQQSYARPVSPQRSPHVLSSNSHHPHHFQGPPNHATNPQHPSYVMRLAKERQLQQQRLLQPQPHFSTPSSMMPHVQQAQEPQLPVSSPQNSARSSSPPVSISPMGTPTMTPKHPVPPPHGLVRNPHTSGNQILKQQRPRPSQQFQHAQPRQKALPQQQAKLMKAVRGNMMMNQNLPTDSSLVNGFSGSQSSADKGLQSGHGNLNAGSSQAADKQSVPQSSLSQPHQQNTFSGQMQKPFQSSDNSDNKNHDSSMVASSTNHHQQQPQGNQKLANRKQVTTPQKVLLNRKFNTSDQSTEKQAESLMVLNTSHLGTAVQIPLAPSNETDDTGTAVDFSSAAPANAGTQLGKSSVPVSSPQTNSVGAEIEHSGPAMNQDMVHRQSSSDNLPNSVEHDGCVQQQQQPPS